MANQIFVLGLMLLMISGTVRAATTQPDVLQTLRAAHPRLIVLDDRIDSVRKQIAGDDLLAAWEKKLTDRAEKMLDEPVCIHKIIGPRMLGQSRVALGHITTLAGMYRLNHDRRFADRAIKEMLAAADFVDWNPPHFLDVAEMSAAMGIGYDWLYDVLTRGQRAKIREAIVKLGLQPGVDAFDAKAWWTTNKNNWPQVCNGGLTIAALAIADEEPEIARKTLENSLESIRGPMSAFAPDGATEKGPGYWNYGTRYNVMYLAALDSALGTDFGLSKLEGFDQTGTFRMEFIGSLGMTFNFGDAGPDPETAWQMFWLAERFNQPSWAADEREIAKSDPNIFHLLMYRQVAGDVKPPPLDMQYKRIAVAYLRGAWDDRNAIYVGFKGGDNSAGHPTLSLGSFILDAGGQRWVQQLGFDDYDLPGYFGKLRWTYYRMRTEGQNTIIVDGDNQDLTAKAAITAFGSTPARAFAVADLSAAYPKVKSLTRGIELLDRKRVIVQDELESPEPVAVVWNLHTPAKVAINDAGNVATLTIKNSTMKVTLIEPKEAKFNPMEVKIDPPQDPIEGITNLRIVLPEKVKQTRIVVRFAQEDPAAPDAIIPLAQWK